MLGTYTQLQIYETKADLALIIEEVLRQRIQGVKNEKGVWVTPAFPKLLYVLEEDNTYAGSKYFYLTQLAAECTAMNIYVHALKEADKASVDAIEGVLKKQAR